VRGKRTESDTDTDTEVGVCKSHDQKIKRGKTENERKTFVTSMI